MEKDQSGKQSRPGSSKDSNSGNVSIETKPVVVQQVMLNGKQYHVVVDDKGCPAVAPVGLEGVLKNLTTVQEPTRLEVDLGAQGGDDQPLYVNAKQYQRILKRRQQRAKLEALGKIPKSRQKFLYESRHRHAVNRQRGAHGRFSSSPGFLNKKAALKSQKQTVKIGKTSKRQRAIIPVATSAASASCAHQAAGDVTGVTCPHIVSEALERGVGHMSVVTLPSVFPNSAYTTSKLCASGKPSGDNLSTPSLSPNTSIGSSPPRQSADSQEHNIGKTSVAGLGALNQCADTFSTNANPQISLADNISTLGMIRPQLSYVAMNENVTNQQESCADMSGSSYSQQNEVDLKSEAVAVEANSQFFVYSGGDKQMRLLRLVNE